VNAGHIRKTCDETGPTKGLHCSRAPTYSGVRKPGVDLSFTSEPDLATRPSPCYQAYDRDAGARGR